jgi:anionic cell wall polymer biosynthesis LytR-Cps2A-Psr (LCP) family protein
MTPLRNVQEILQVIENIQKTNFTNNEKNKLIVQFIYSLLEVQNNKIYNLSMFNAKNEIQLKTIERSIFLEQCLTELENL